MFKPVKFLPLGILGFTTVAAAQDTSPPPPAVGVVSAEKRLITEAAGSGSAPRRNWLCRSFF